MQHSAAHVTRRLLLSASLPAHSFSPIVAVAQQMVDLNIHNVVQTTTRGGNCFILFLSE